jgi:hypothetical protein
MTKSRRILIFISALMMVGVLAFASYRSVSVEEYSPKKQYRIVFVKASEIDRLFLSDMELPRKIKLYDQKSGRLLRESGWIDVFGNGNIRFFNENQRLSINVGMDVWFENLEPEK